MATNTNINISKQDPKIEAYRLGLLQDVQKFIADQIAAGPAEGMDYTVADITAAEKAALGQAEQGIGAYQDFVTSGEQALTSGQGLIGQAASGLAGIGSFNPYEEQVVQQTLADIGRQGLIEENRLKSQGVSQGAFGGTRQAVAERELGRNVLEEQARAAGQLRQQGFESAMDRQLRGSELLGNLGTNLGSMGVQQAGLGEIAQGLTSSQISNALTTGGVARGIDQAALDAVRMSNVQQEAYPFQQYGFLSDIYSGIPTSSSTITAGSAPQASPFQTALGLGIGSLGAIQGAKTAGIF